MKSAEAGPLFFVAVNDVMGLLHQVQHTPDADVVDSPRHGNPFEHLRRLIHRSGAPFVSVVPVLASVHRRALLED